MMMGFGLLIMLAVLGIPILLIAGLVLWMVIQGTLRDNHPSTVHSLPAAPASSPSAGAGHVCSHCGAGLQPEWTHCPQCGAPAG